MIESVFIYLAFFIVWVDFKKEKKDQGGGREKKKIEK